LIIKVHRNFDTNQICLLSGSFTHFISNQQFVTPLASISSHSSSAFVFNSPTLPAYTLVFNSIFVLDPMTVKLGGVQKSAGGLDGTSLADDSGITTLIK
jgi:hypothetical protein